MMSKSELIEYYKSEIERFKKQGGVGARLNVPVLEQLLRGVEDGRAHIS